MNSKGEARFDAMIRLKRKGGTHPPREPHLTAAESSQQSDGGLGSLSWKDRGALEAIASLKTDTQLGELILKYREDFSDLGKWSRTKHATLKAIESMDLARKDATTLEVVTVATINALVRRDAGGRCVGCYLHS